MPARLASYPRAHWACFSALADRRGSVAISLAALLCRPPPDSSCQAGALFPSFACSMWYFPVLSRVARLCFGVAFALVASSSKWRCVLGRLVCLSLGWAASWCLCVSRACCVSRAWAFRGVCPSPPGPPCCGLLDVRWLGVRTATVVPPRCGVSCGFS